MSTLIDWTDEVWNPATGCTKVSQGCKNCYAERMANRLRGRHGYPADDPFKVTLHENRLPQPLRWRKARKVFVCSMGDLFHDDVSFDFIDKVFAVMALCPQHTFQVLTKRPERMAEYLSSDNGALPGRTPSGEWIRGRHRVVVDAAISIGRDLDERAYKSAKRNAGGEAMTDRWPLPNVWLGTSTEDQATADERIPHLLRCPAAIRFLSVEPMLGPTDLFSPMPVELAHEVPGIPTWPKHWTTTFREYIHQVIIGCESKAGGRVGRLSVDPERNEADWFDWAITLARQVKSAGVALFVKQIPHEGELLHARDAEKNNFRGWPLDLKRWEMPT